MQVVPLALNGLLHAIGSYWGSVHSAPVVECRVQCPPPSPIDGQLLGILRDQLTRCGPAELNIRECPACVCPGHACPGCTSVALLAGAVGVLIGLLVAAAFLPARRLVATTHSSGSPAQVAQLEPGPAVITPSSLRRRGD